MKGREWASGRVGEGEASGRVDEWARVSGASGRVASGEWGWGWVGEWAREWAIKQSKEGKEGRRTQKAEPNRLCDETV